ncbi:MAG: hypothetical protein BGP14_03525 [Sphingobacteriales bacterium 44-15]|nr:MAG: hypothetical protein BGP14_03525 [Sphingobacteriales bacterium 44-15]
MSETANKFKYVWQTPLLLSVLTLSGLLSALLGTGIWRVAAWVALSIPLLIICRFVFIKRRR